MHGALNEATYSTQSHHSKLPTCSSSTQASHTCTGLCIAQVKLFAHTILAAICRRRVAAISALTPTATSFRAWTKRGPAAVHFTVLCQAICNATDACSVSDGDCTVFKTQWPRKQQFARTTPDQKYQQPAPAQACALHAFIASPVQSLPPFAGAGLLQALL